MIKKFTFDTLDSSSLKAFSLLQKSEKTPFYISCSSQTQGRGTSDKTWVSPRGGLYLQAVYPFESIPLLPQKVGLIIAKSLYDMLEISVTIKWPNDLIFSGKKMAGILCEVHTISTKKYLSIGIGLNLLKLTSDSKFCYKPTSLQEISSKKINLKHLEVNLIERLHSYFFLKQYKLKEKDLKNFFMPINTLWHEKNKLEKCFSYSSLSDEGFLSLKRKSETITVNSAKNSYTWYFLDNNLYPKPILILESSDKKIKLSFFSDFREKNIKKQITLSKKTSLSDFNSFLTSILVNSKLELIPIISLDKEDQNIDVIKELIEKEALIFYPVEKGVKAENQKEAKDTALFEAYLCQKSLSNLKDLKLTEIKTLPKSEQDKLITLGIKIMGSRYCL